jgi:hypothetical protein
MNIEMTRLNSLLLNKKKDIEVLEEQNKSFMRNAEDNRKSTVSNQDTKKTIVKY